MKKAPKKNLVTVKCLSNELKTAQSNESKHLSLHNQDHRKSFCCGFCCVENNKTDFNNTQKPKYLSRKLENTHTKTCSRKYRSKQQKTATKTGKKYPNFFPEIVTFEIVII